VIREIYKKVVREIFELIADNVREMEFEDESEMVAYVVQSWIHVFDYYFVEQCPYCAHKLEPSSVNVFLSSQPFRAIWRLPNEDYDHWFESIQERNEQACGLFEERGP